MRLRSFLPAALAAAGLLAATGACRPASSDGGPRRRAVPFAVAMVRDGKRAGTRLTVRPGSVVVLDGSESGADVKDVEITHRWSQTAGPEVRLARDDIPRTEVRLTKEGDYGFQLVTSCGGRDSRPSPVWVVVERAAGSGALPGVEPVSGEAPPKGSGVFALLDSDAEELIRIFGARTGLTLRVSPDWMRPEELKSLPVTFMARRVRPRSALEMAARLTGSCYVRDRRDAAFLAVGLGWVRSEKTAASFFPTPGIAPPRRAGKLAELVREACRGALFACPKSKVLYDRRRDGLHVTGPASMHGRVEGILAALDSEQKRLPPRPPLSGDEKHQRAVLGRKLKLLLVNREMSQAALELGHELGVPIAWEQGPGRKRYRPPRISVRGADRPAREVLAELAKKAGFRGFCWVAGGGVWLYRTEPRPPSAEHLWRSAEARSYPVAELRKRGVLPGAALHMIRKKIYPGSWRHPATLSTYYRQTDRLLVVHSPRVQREVLRLLHDLLEEEPRSKKP